MPAPSRRAPAKTRTRETATANARGADRPDNVTRAYEELRHIIVWGQLAPGSRISERIIADRLGLSRTPVRSALHRLEQEGFVASTGRGRERRLIVAPLTMSDGQEVYSIVGHLEGLAARLAAALPAARRKEIAARLREVNGTLAALARGGGDATDFFDLDIEFHRSYVEGVVGPRLLTLHRAIKPQSDRYTRLYVTVFLNQAATSVREHATIIDAIARGDADAAQLAAETNWNNAAERLTRVIARHGERGSWGGWSDDARADVADVGAVAAPAPPAARARRTAPGKAPSAR
jgi:DNA-binding GntR family transcriptional regulator